MKARYFFPLLFFVGILASIAINKTTSFCENFANSGAYTYVGGYTICIVLIGIISFLIFCFIFYIFGKIKKK